MSTPKDGTVLNGFFWLQGQSWLITDLNEPLEQHLAKSLITQRQYIARLTKRADDLEKWLETEKQNNEFKSKSRAGD
ncbi:MAG: hypothetical protein EKK64_04770 [Neisseriaceae bacterium]|nr:MAG: hypothetical protein EKK64_04770 [Neisseriaceae bacterium]